MPSLELILLRRHVFTALGADNQCEITGLGCVQPAKDQHRAKMKMHSRRLVALTMLCGALVLAGWGAAGYVRSTSRDTTAKIVADEAPPAATPLVETPNTVIAKDAVPAVDTPVVAADDAAVTTAAAPAPAPVPAPAEQPVQVASLRMPEPALVRTKEPEAPVITAEACLASDECVDRYLFALYERAPKVDSILVPEQVKVTVTKKGKTRTVTKTVQKPVDDDFGWKDPKAAEKAGMALMKYVIGGMDRGFKLKLYRALRAMDEAGLEPGITSGFRDDYRQTLASGKKAAFNRSYHGGSLRGGYGHGMAADLVSVKGATRAERCASSEVLWKWVDVHGKEFGVGRPYLNRDPPHVGPIDGQEYVEKRGLAKPKLARVDTNKHDAAAVKEDQTKTKPAKTAASKAGSVAP
jgi:hypothetical protein